MSTSIRLSVAGLLAAATLVSAMPAAAKEFRWAATTDPVTLDPHGTNTAPVLGFLNNVYEGLVRRNPAMEVEPALAERWEPIGSEGWRFFLRKGVTFHNGAEFNADDVIFSYERASSEDSDVRSWFAPVTAVNKVDDYTVEFMTSSPNPLFPGSIANWMILDQGWAVDNAAEKPSRETGNHATLNANGTGAFKVESREAGVKTVLVPFDGWWDTPQHNITRATFTPITSAATAVAALLSGEIDFFEPVPLQDIPRLKSTSGLKVVEGIESRVIFFGFELEADELRFSDVKGKNPFKDVRVRQAIYHAIDAEAIAKKIMRGNAQTTGLLIGPGINGYRAEEDTRLEHDPAKAKALLAEAGYPEGFSFGMRCPNDRYINDEAICSAAVAMLSKVGLKVQLTAVPVRGYWNELRADEFDMFMLGWSPGTFDAEHPMRFLLATPNNEKKLGSWNFGAYSNARIDELLPQIQAEIDPAKRQAMVDEVHAILKADVPYVPLHIQPLVWATRSNIDLAQRNDNFFILNWVTIN
jgi:peptide/nickel transport system substrate-binding protein